MTTTTTDAETAEQTTVAANKAEKKKRGRPLLRPAWADAISMYIPDERTDVWVSGAELSRHTGLTLAQVMAGIAYIREQFPEFSLVSSRKGYRFTEKAQEVNFFRIWRVRTAYTVIFRLCNGVVFPFLRHHKSSTADRIEVQFRRILEDLNYLIDSEVKV